MEPEATEQLDTAAERRVEIRLAAGAFSGVYPPDVLAALSDEWPD